MKHIWRKISPWVLTCLAGMLANLAGTAITANLWYRSPDLRSVPGRECTVVARSASDRTIRARRKGSLPQVYLTDVSPLFGLFDELELRKVGGAA